MRKLIFSFGLFLLLLSSSTAIAQNVEVIGGFGKNNFYDRIDENDGHFRSEYSRGSALMFGIALDDIYLDSHKLRFTLSIERYSGKFEVYDGGLGGGFKTIADIDKSVISIGIYPLNIKIKNKLDINIGFEVSRLLSERFSGEHSGSTIHPRSWRYRLEEHYKWFNSFGYFGFRGRIAYDINLTKNLSISPQYSYYLGTRNEFKNFPEATKSMRQYFSIGIQKKLTPNK